jgi:predicted DNA-binding transcriptional regulator YafY
MPPIEKRLLFWDEKFRTKRVFTLRQLFDAFSEAFDIDISIRTFRNDMNLLRERGAPLSIKRFDIKNKLLDADNKSHYAYTNDFSLSVRQPITIEDAGRIQQAVHILKQFKHLPQFQYLEDILFKLEREADIKADASIKSKDIIQFEQVSNLRGIERLEMLYQAIVKEHVMDMFYLEFGQNTIQTLLHPYFLKEFNNRWYVFGLDQNKHIIRPFALDRIERLAKSPMPFLSNLSVDFSIYFDDRIGISALDNPPIETIVIKVSQPRAQYVITKPWHTSQIIVEETPQYVSFQYRLIINQELEARVLEFGKDIQIVEPLHFRTRIATILKQALTFY